MRKQLFFLILLASIEMDVQAQSQNIVANPMNLNYRFQFDEPSRREAADPVCEYFKGKYYLFASKSGGSWSSPDLKNWTYIPYSTIATIVNYAPAILVLNGTLYYMIGGSPRIFYTVNPDIDDWKELNTKFEHGTADPAFFKDEDTGKVYIYWGCSDVDPIVGVEVDPGNGFKSIGYPKPLIEHNGDKYGWEVPGKNNEETRPGWNEGPCMTKYNGKYYL
jgi:beta-xylosidase